jgi:hypothetical protein
MEGPKRSHTQEVSEEPSVLVFVVWIGSPYWFQNWTPGLVLVCFSKLNKIQVWVPIMALQIRPGYGFGWLSLKSVVNCQSTRVLDHLYPKRSIFQKLWFWFWFKNWVLVPVLDLESGPIKNLVPVLEPGLGSSFKLSKNQTWFQFGSR